MRNATGKTRFTRWLTVLSIAMLAGGILNPAPANAAKEITIVTPAWQPDSIKAFQDAIAEWNKRNPSTPVKMIPGDWDNLGDQLTTQFLAGNAPDIIHFDAASSREYAMRGYLANLNTLMEPLKKKIPSGAWKTASYQGKLFGVPFVDQTYVVFANVDAFKKAGVKLPDAKSGLTWDQFQALSKKLTTSTQYGLSYGLLRPATSFMVMSSNFNATYFSNLTSSKAQLRVGSTELEVPNRIYNMFYVDKSIDPISLTVTAGGSVAPFLAGKTAMLLGGSYIAADLDLAKKEKGFNWTALPLLKGTSKLQAANPQIFAVNQASKVKTDAAKFIQFLMSDKHLVKLALGDALIPLTYSARQAAITAKKGNSGWIQILSDGANFTVAPFASVPQYEQWRSTVLQAGLQEFMQNKIDRATLVKKLEDGWRAIQ
ncbi:MAG: hypothetical protein RLY84_401 [Actinomycetota bacterium]